MTLQHVLNSVASDTTRSIFLVELKAASSSTLFSMLQPLVAILKMTALVLLEPRSSKEGSESGLVLKLECVGILEVVAKRFRRNLRIFAVLGIIADWPYIGKHIV